MMTSSDVEHYIFGCSINQDHIKHAITYHVSSYMYRNISMDTWYAVITHDDYHNHDRITTAIIIAEW